jgi:GTP diphosphokinase / guanosine-3',5'-bis(diphosphate) 3'-diphosphatase
MTVVAETIQRDPSLPYGKWWPEIEAAYAGMVSAIKSEVNEEDRKDIDDAFRVAATSHAEQWRKSGEPYIFHPIAVARICAEEIGLGPTAIVAALLHDTVEDTQITLDDVRERFGDRLASMVDGLTKLDAAYQQQHEKQAHTIEQQESQQALNFKKVLSTLVQDVRVVLIKMADRLHNMRTIGSMPNHKQLKIAAETSYIYAPLAHRLGLYRFRTEFLDLCMKIMDRDDYDEVARQLQDTKKAREDYIEKFLAPINEELAELGVPVRTFGRPKSIYSIWNKIRSKKVPFDQIYDLFAVRIVLDVPVKKEKSFCWQAYSLVTDVYQPIPQRLKDWVTNPKSNGYESLHTTVVGPDGRFVEVQIRSERMDEIAERGFAAHWKYKGVTNQPDVYENWLDSVREILEDPNSDAVEFLGDFRANNFFNEEVYVFTPAGDMRMLPKGATALDFAFSIHSDVGYHCQAVRVNNVIVPLSYPLQNGDRVEVFTNNRQKPSEGWLKMVTTGKAKSKIRSSMKEERKKQGELGREALERKFRHHRVQNYEAAVDMLVKHFGLPSPTDLYYNIAMDAITVKQIFKQFHVELGKLVPNAAPKNVVPNQPERKRSSNNRVEGKTRLLINGEPGDQYEYTFATCCNPVQGDQVFAYLTMNAGLKIHRVNCPNATNLMANYGYRIMKAEWVSTTGTYFVAALKITGIDSGPGVIQQLSQHISQDLGLNIRSFSISGQDGHFEGKISLLVTNTDQLKLAIRRLQNLDNVSTVIREES